MKVYAAPQCELLLMQVSDALMLSDENETRIDSLLNIFGNKNETDQAPIG